jgi:adenylosuccinate synthase
MKASIVLGLGFGDEGKGITTDFLCSNSDNPIVVRFSGGQQAGHTVVKNGVRHIHSSYGSGTLRGVPSYFSEHTTMYLNSLVNEREVLLQKGITPELYLHPLTMVTTPYDVAYNRLMEEKIKHGSCGLGIAATMKRNLETGYKLYAVDLKYPSVYKQKIEAIKKYYSGKVMLHDQLDYIRLYDYAEDYFFENLERKDLFQVEDYSCLYGYDHIIFEGSQGILLDMNHGFFPNVTYANTTSKNVLEIYNKLSGHKIPPQIYYVTRCYQTRHGRGWMSNEQNLGLVNNKKETNVTNNWQENFRVGEIDYDLINYALDVDSIYSKNLVKKLVVTCLDQRPGFQFDYTKLKYSFKRYLESRSDETKLVPNKNQYAASH